MSSPDVSDVASAVSGISIQGPAETPGKVDLTGQDVTKVMPGELDPLVGANPVPAQIVESRPGDGGTPATAHVVEHPTLVEPTAVTLTSGSVDIHEFRPTPAIDELFDSNDYRVGVTIDKQSADEVVIAFSGSIKLPAEDEDARAYWDSLTLGKWVNLRVGGFVAGKAGGYKEDKDGESTVSGKVTVKVTDLNVLRPEDL